ncbi:MAG: hypothetical protein ABW252_04160 [Polyangiales bacterium]
MHNSLARTSAMFAFLTVCMLGDATASAQAVKRDLAINGPYYAQIVQMKDLVADVLPPPAYIIETYLTVLQIVDALDQGSTSASVSAFVDYGKLLKNGSPGVFPGYFERIDVWKAELSEATPEDAALKKAMVVDSAEPAARFFALLESEFYPAALAGDTATAKRLARGPLKSAYAAHRAGVDTVVRLSRDVNARIEAEVAAKLAASAASDDVLIGGPLYAKVIQMKDLVADVLPPPAYIIESYLTVLELIDLTESKADPAVIAAAVELGRQLARGDSSKGELAGYAERQAFWVKDLSTATPAQASLKKLMVEDAAAPALAFFDTRDAVFTPRVLAGDVAGAKAVARTQLLAQYAAHRKAIDAVVAAANARYAAVDAEVKALLR